MSSRRRRRRTIALVFAIAAVATLVLAGLSYRKIVSRWVTARALEDAEALVEAANASFDDSVEEISRQLAEDYGDWFRRDFFDRGEVVRHLPAAGAVPELAPPFCVIAAYYLANEETFEPIERASSSAEVQPLVAREFRAWADALLVAPHAKEILVNLLAADYTMYTGRDPARDDGSGLAKRLLVGALLWEGEPDLLGELLDLDEEEFRTWQDLLLAQIDTSHWRAVLRDLDHPREKVRAGSLLLLWRHPRREVLIEKARAALDDPSRWVRLAAAGLLALEGLEEGSDVLVDGLEHERWEVRWWSAFALASLGPRWADRAAERAPSEPDEWVKKQLLELQEAARYLEEMRQESGGSSPIRHEEAYLELER